jgi:hypothetical protein
MALRERNYGEDFSVWWRWVFGLAYCDALCGQRARGYGD